MTPGFGTRRDAQKRYEVPSPALPLPAVPWRGPTEIYLSRSKLDSNVRREYGEARPLWPVAGWSTGERALWEALSAVVALAPLLDVVRERCDDHEIGCLASLLEQYGAAMQPAASRVKGIS